LQTKKLDLVNPQIQSYAEAISSKEYDLLNEIHQFTLKNHPEYQMLSGHLQGKFLEMISCMIRPQRILEIGTFTGYSALCLARGLQEDGELHTIELREKDAQTAREYFTKSNYASKIILHQGNAKDIIPVLKETWDLVFIDADKTGYIDYFNLVLPRVKKNGFILADNIFFHGQVIENPVSGKNAKAIKAFNEFISARTDIEKVAITLRDGLYLIKKL
jgi:caffeoyl-CoA O-methyltransferase